jgi:uncharacterized protein YneF (UPF0154 family)
MKPAVERIREFAEEHKTLTSVVVKSLGFLIGLNAALSIGALMLGKSLMIIGKLFGFIKIATGWVIKHTAAKIAETAAINTNTAAKLKNAMAGTGMSAAQWAGHGGGARAAQLAEDWAAAATGRARFGKGPVGALGNAAVKGLEWAGFAGFAGFLTKTPWAALTAGVGSFLATIGLVVTTFIGVYTLTRDLMEKLNMNNPIQNIMMKFMDQKGHGVESLGERSQEALRKGQIKIGDDGSVTRTSGADMKRLEQLQSENNRILAQHLEQTKQVAGNTKPAAPGRNQLAWNPSF